MCVYTCMYVWMDGWMYVCMYVFNTTGVLSHRCWENRLP